MKKTLIALALGSAFSGAAFAQSSVTIYGLIDASLHEETKVNAAGNNKLLIDEGAFNGSRLGFKGSEDLGGGSSAIFQIEAGYFIGTGASDQQGQLFGRQAYVGLSNPVAGTLTLGRQYGVGFVWGFDFDPLGWGNWTQNSWQAGLTGIRFDNSIVYANNFNNSPVNIQLQYSVGGQAGSATNGSTVGGEVEGKIATVKLGAFGQQSQCLETAGACAAATTGTKAKDTVYGVGATGTFAIVTPYLNYIHSKKDAGFAKAASLSGLPLANTSLTSNPDTVARTDKFWTAGLGIQATPTIGFTVAIMDDKVNRSISYSERTIYGFVTFALSKRTDWYLGFDSNHITNVALGAAPLNTVLGSGQSSSTDYGIGIRHRF